MRGLPNAKAQIAFLLIRQCPYKNRENIKILPYLFSVCLHILANERMPLFDQIYDDPLQ